MRTSLDRSDHSELAEADRIRAALTAQGIELIDKPGEITEWRRA
ncbi:hypothetical protein [Synechococcus sp. UW105]|nr:hypothetical protein [Synechococcus sp. UW105]